MLKQAKLPMSTAGNVELCIPGQKASIEEIHARQQTAGRKNAMAENERSCSTEALSCPVKERGKVKFPKKAENHFSLLDDDDTSETEEVEAQEFKTLNSADECWSDSDGEERERTITQNTAGQCIQCSTIQNAADGATYTCTNANNSMIIQPDTPCRNYYYYYDGMVKGSQG